MNHICCFLHKTSAVCRNHKTAQYQSKDTLSCTVKCVDSGEVTVTAKVVDAEGNTVTDENGNDATASQVLTMKAGFFARVEAFFKNLWNLIVNLFK